MNGALVYKGALYLSAGNAYAGTQTVTHWRRPLDLAAKGKVEGPVTVRGNGEYSNPRFTAGYMCHVPPELQGMLGGPAITGWVADSIVSMTSNGPAAFVFDPLDFSKSSSVPAKPLLFYPVSARLETPVRGQRQRVWNDTSIPRGCAIPEGTRSLLFIGRHGTGPFDYGVGGPNGYSTTDGPKAPIYDPADSSTGEHAWPYRYQVWAYDVNEFGSVRDGKRKPESIRPYAVWNISLPFVDPSANHDTEGMAYDPKRMRLFLVQSMAGPWGEPAVHVFQVNGAVARQ